MGHVGQLSPRFRRPRTRSSLPPFPIPVSLCSLPPAWQPRAPVPSTLATRFLRLLRRGSRVTFELTHGRSLKPPSQLRPHPPPIVITQLPPNPFLMPKVSKKGGFYAVARGQVPGVYTTWCVGLTSVSLNGSSNMVPYSDLVLTGSGGPGYTG